jgi:3-isopropylmalate dehydrogenase
MNEQRVTVSGAATRSVTLLVMGGDGIGPEVTAQGVRVVRCVAGLFGHRITIDTHEVGEAAQHRTGSPFPDSVREACDARGHDAASAILFGASVDEPIGILRKRYDLFANLRPIKMMPSLVGRSPLQIERVNGLDLLFVRELVSDIYYGATRSGSDEHGRWAVQEMYYNEREVRRIVRVGLDAARARRRRLALVHKRNVIKDIFEIWFDVLSTEAKAYPDVVVSDVLVDTMAMRLVLAPTELDVVLCSNLFGDILSDLGAGLLGSLGLLPSASINEHGFALYEPVGGTAPDLVGKGLANPAASILSVAMFCRHTLGDDTAASCVEQAVSDVLQRHRTPDLAGDGCELVGTVRFGDLVIARMSELFAARS